MLESYSIQAVGTIRENKERWHNDIKEFHHKGLKPILAEKNSSKASLRDLAILYPGQTYSPTPLLVFSCIFNHKHII